MTAQAPVPSPLSRSAMRQAMDRIMAGAMPSEEISALLRGLAQRGESAEEIAGGVDSLREHAVRLPLSRAYELCDTCGTGGDGQGTINVSTLAALIVAACGVRVAKHGNRAASSRCGSADLLAALGLNLEAEPTRVAESLETLGFGFCFAPRFHPAMKAVAPIRKALGIRTIFNLIGPLANPAPLAWQLVGVSEARVMRPMAEALQALGLRHALVVHGRDGLDEVTTTRETDVLEVRPSGIQSFEISPDEFSMPRSTPADLKGGDPIENARLAQEILAGASSPRLDLVVLNAGSALYAADHVTSIREGVTRAIAAVEDGRAARLLTQVIELSNR